jgi:PAS domain S-box-containing protein
LLYENGHQVPNQLDYILFSFAAMLILGVLAYALKSRHGVKLNWFWWSACIFTLLLGGWITSSSGIDSARQQEDSLVVMARTYALDLERMGHEKITSKTQPDAPIYREVCKALSDWRIANPFVDDIYTVRRSASGETVFIADPETDYNNNKVIDGEREKATPIGESFDERDAGLERALAGEANFNPEVVQDRWGSWVGAWAPIRDASGKIDAVVGVDYDAGKWRAIISEARRSSMLHFAFLLALVAIGGAVLAILRSDLARRGEAEARLRNSDERMQLTIRQMPIGFIEWDAKARVLAWNPMAEKIFGYSPTEACGTAMFDEIVANSARIHVDKIFEDLIANRGGTHSINDNLTKDGRVITCEWFNTPLVNERGDVVSVFSLMQDITERMRLEKHVQQSQRLNAVGQLAAGVAHDFNNILTIVTGHTGLLLSRDDIPSDARTDLERVESAALRAASLTRQLLTFSRQQAMFPRPVSINEIVQVSAELLGRVIGEHIRFNIRLADALPAVDADAAMLDQVITNLAINARDAMPRGGILSISTAAITVTEADVIANPEARVGPAVELCVADTGNGIKAENLARIFEPFFTTKEVGKGTGLGLAVVHGIVRQHRGWISVESEMGKGTAFHVVLPASEKAAQTIRTQATTSFPAVPRKQKTILIVEDEEVLRELARTILERAGYRVLDAEDGPTALQIWARQKTEIDMLITDMVMPNGVTGRELAQRLVAERPELPVIYASGYSQELTAPDFVETERRVFLQKPYTGEQLVALVKRLVGK